ncbi:MAG: hypothetical protein OEY94_06590 [Alphaproteobacteria bacterium]|nr:hypothetical protein [Alphaproteobacteria bacterium]
MRQILVAREPRSKRPRDVFIYVPEQKSEFDVTGRRIREEQPKPFSLVKDYRPKPFGEEAIKKILSKKSQAGHALLFLLLKFF